MKPLDQLKSILCDPEGKCCIAGTDEDRAIVDRALKALAQPAPSHPDDLAVDRFATAMKEKMAKARAKGRNGWNDPEKCPTERLQTMLAEHIAKGDPVDVGNFAMMLWDRVESTAARPSQKAIEWPNARDVGRYGDMSPSAHLRVGLDTDNDVYLSVWDESGGASIEFCTPGAGGGDSPATRMALIALMLAIEQDNAQRPDKDWWAKRKASHERAIETAKKGNT
jgi:hypothetical protein